MNSSESFPPEKQIDESESATSINYVTYEVDLDNPPPLSAEDKLRIARLAQMPDEDIDYSDAPSLPDEFWENAVRGRFYRGNRIAIAPDVLTWFRSHSKDYQASINDVLRKEIAVQEQIVNLGETA